MTLASINHRLSSTQDILGKGPDNSVLILYNQTPATIQPLNILLKLTFFSILPNLPSKFHDDYLFVHLLYVINFKLLHKRKKLQDNFARGACSTVS